MKLFIVLLAVFALAHADDEWKPKTAAEIKEIRIECFKENPLNEDLINKLKNFEYPDEEVVRKYLLCSGVKMGIFSVYEGYIPERVAKQFKMDLDESEVLEIVKNCIDKNEQGSSVDVWAFRSQKCFMSSKMGERVKAYVTKKREEAQKSD